MESQTCDNIYHKKHCIQVMYDIILCNQFLSTSKSLFAVPARILKKWLNCQIHCYKGAFNCFLKCFSFYSKQMPFWCHQSSQNPSTHYLCKLAIKILAIFLDFLWKYFTQCVCTYYCESLTLSYFFTSGRTIIVIESVMLL